MNRSSKTRLRALYGLLKYPEKTQREVADLVGLRLSTLNAAKKRLEAERWVRPVVIPIVQKFGFEYLFAAFRTQALTAAADRLAGVEEKIAALSRHTFVSIHEGTTAFALGVARDREDLQRYEALVQEQYREADLRLVPETTVLEAFPFGDLAIHRVCDFSDPIAHAHGLERVPLEQRPTRFQPTTAPDLSPLQRRVLTLLVEQGEITDMRGAQLLGTSRQTFARIRGQLRAMNLIFKARVPDLRAAGLGVLSVSLLKFGGGTEANRTEEVRWGLREMPIGFAAATRDRVLLGGATRDFVTLRSLIRQVPERLLRGPHATEGGITFQFSTELMKAHAWFDFRRIAEGLVNGGSDDRAKR